MSSISKAGVGGLVLVFVAAAEYFGVVFPEGETASMTEALSVLVGVILFGWGQLDRGDLKGGLLRKE